MLTALFAASDRLVFAFVASVDRAQRPREIWNGTPEHQRGRPLPPLPTPERW